MPQDPHSNSARRRWQRRDFLKLSATTVAGAGAFALVGCGGDDDDDSSPTADITTIGGSSSPTQSATAATPTEQPVHGGILKSSGGDAPNGHWDYLTAVAPAVVTVTQQVYSGLIALADDNSLQPDLAEGWEQVSDTEVVFRLRPGVTWHDGTPFTAEDVVTTLDFIRQPPEGVVSPRKAQLAAIDSITAVDPNTVSIKLKQPSAALLVMLASTWLKIAPKHILATKGSLQEDTIGTGPFMYDRWDKSISIKLARNPNYWNSPEPYLDGIEYFIFADNAAKEAAFETGQIHEAGYVTGTPGKQWVDKLRREMAEKVNVYRVYGTLTPYIVLNNQRKPFDDVRVRRALALAFDHEEAIQAVGLGEARLSGPVACEPWILPEDELRALPGYSGDKEKDLAEAKALLEAAGVSGASFEITYQAASDYGDNAAYFQAVWARLGLNGQPQGYTTADFSERRLSGNFDVLYHIEAIGYNDPDDWLLKHYLSTSPSNYGKYADANLDAKLQRQSQILDPAERRALTDEIQKDLIRDHIQRVWLPQRPFFRAAWKEVRNLQQGPDLYSQYHLADVYLSNA